MPEFILATAGTIRDVRAPSIEAVKRVDLDFEDLDAFTQGYIEAMFFTSTGNIEDGDLQDAAFADLAPETLAAVVADCAAFMDSAAWRHLGANALAGEMEQPDDAQAGRDFWYTRNGHGCGFWDGDWLEPYASELDKAARQFRSVDLYRGDDGKVYLS